MKYLSGFTAAALIACTTLVVAHAAPSADQSQKCDPVKEITQLYRGDSAVVWRFPAADSATLVDFFSMLYGERPPVPIGSVWLGLDSVDESLAFFFMGADGCGVKAMGGLDKPEVIDLLNQLNIRPPIGSTYYQIPNAPGGLPGSSI